MEKCDYLQSEIDSKLGDIKMTNRMKNHVKAVCLGEKECKGNLFSRRGYKRVGIIAASIFVLTGTVMAMDYTCGFGIFFNHDNLSKAAKEIQTMSSFSEDNNVKLTVEEMIMQPYSSTITLSFINETGQPWPEDIESRSLDIDWPESTKMHKGGANEGMRYLSEDGKRLSYCFEIDNHENINNDKVCISAENLVQTKKLDKIVNLPIGEYYEKQGVKVDAHKYDFKVVEAPLNKVLEEAATKESNKIILDEEYPSTYLMGGGFLMNDEAKVFGYQDASTGVVLCAKNEGYPDDARGDADAYVEGSIKEVTDMQTGKKYEAKFRCNLQDGTGTGQVNVSYFPGIEESQMPYLQITKVSYEKQEVVAVGSWQIEMSLNENKNLVKWTPDIEWQKGENTVYVDEVYLSTMGVQVRMHMLNSATKKFVGCIQAVPIQIITDTGEEISLEHRGTQAVEHIDNAIEGYVLDYSQYTDNGEVYFLDVAHIKKVIINNQTLEVKH